MNQKECKLFIIKAFSACRVVRFSSDCSLSRSYQFFISTCTLYHLPYFAGKRPCMYSCNKRYPQC
ncbi:hypothetical protein RchiOBHm_Chr7g0198841 [Rosa chinensis]|uniref:Uncharacterized protein n=1 Tax=Rosa chinensis TaxID=74649 RepID=A0A2P6P7C0_ROSCH|nr:hypothetical protein RchiOBHm_Chr7g0198841 [Rosa chinensis]